MIKKNFSAILCYLSIFVFGILIFKPALATDAGLLANGVQQFFDSSGKPLASGKVYFYKVGTSTFQDTYTSSAATTINQNPITLNAGGKATTGGIYGVGLYRQLLKDVNGNTIWDAVTSPGSGGGGSATAVGDGNLVGTVLPWSGLIAPNQYAFAYGQEVSRTTYPELYTAVTQQLNVICSSSSNTLTGLADTSQINIGSPIELPLCVSAGTTVIQKTAATVTLSNPSSVSINSVATFFPYGNGNGATTFNIPDLRGLVIAGRDNMGGSAAGRLSNPYFSTTVSPDALGAVGGLQSHTLVNAEAPVLVDPGHQHLMTQLGTGTGYTNGSESVAAGAVSYFPRYTVSSGHISTDLSPTNISYGGGLPHSIVQPTITLNYIIKVTPDTSLSIATGVYSIGGMSGIISCGSGLLCTGNIVSVNQGIVPPSGISGGVLFFSNTVTISSSNILSANNLVIGGGAGVGPTTINCATSTTVVHGGSPPACSQIVNTDITTNTISNSNLKQTAAATIKGNPTAALADVQDFTFGSLTQTISPTSVDWIPIFDNATGTIKKVNAGSIASINIAGVSSIAGNAGAFTLSTGIINSTNDIRADVATAANFEAGTANKILDSAGVFTPEATTTYGTTTAFDFNTFINTKVTLTGNITTMNCSNMKASQAGTIAFIQDGTGSRTAAFNTGTCSTTLKFAGATFPTLTISASAVDILSYSCRSSTYCAAGLSKGYNP